jgi:hypothetical protein
MSGHHALYHILNCSTRLPYLRYLIYRRSSKIESNKPMTIMKEVQISFVAYCNFAEIPLINNITLLPSVTYREHETKMFTLSATIKRPTEWPFKNFTVISVLCSLSFVSADPTVSGVYTRWVAWLTAVPAVWVDGWHFSSLSYKFALSIGNRISNYRYLFFFFFFFFFL